MEAAAPPLGDRLAIWRETRAVTIQVTARPAEKNQPQSPGRRLLRSHDGDGTEQQRRNRHVEDELGDAPGGYRIDDIGAGKAVAEHDHAEDRQDGIENRVQPSEPGLAGRLFLLEGIDMGGFLEAQADIVEAVQQAVLAERIDLELDHAAIGAADFLFGQVDA